MDPAPPPRTPVVLAHGFTQTAGCWGDFGRAIGRARPMLAVDLAGHGIRSTSHEDLPGAARLLMADARAALGGDDPVDLLGYSMGARIALRAALDHPGQVHRLVLLSGTAGIADPDARAARRDRDAAMADGLERSGDLAGFLDRWLALPMFARLGHDDAQLGARLANTPEGLASSLRLAGTGSQEPMWEALADLSCPVLAVAGATDARYVALASRLARSAPDAVWSMVSGAGHALHLEQPASAARLVTTWLDLS